MIPATAPPTRRLRLVAPPLEPAAAIRPPSASAASGVWPPGAWRRELAHAVTDVCELLALVGVSEEAVGARQVADFPLKVPRPYIARMRFGDADDPLLRQVLPTAPESQPAPTHEADPLREAEASVGVGVLRKYAGRALVIAAGACAVHCRYCFRRHFPYHEHRQDSSFPALAAVRADATISEVILSGGDPWLLTDGHFAALVAAVAAIDHVTTLRIHTRLPVVIPQRVTAALVDTLAKTRPRVVVVSHFNHPHELDADCARALRALAGFTLLNQSVLLRGVNDDAAVLAELSERLFAAGALPYYLHMPDAVAGTAHFDVSTGRALAIHRDLAARLPGYLVPRLVRETPGAAAKQHVVAALA